MSRSTTEAVDLTGSSRHDEFDDVTRRHQFIPARLASKENKARVVALAGSLAGERFPVENELVFGRSTDVAVRVDDVLVSRRHARIGRDDQGGYSIEDLGSRNGTRVNGEKIQGLRALSYGDRIQVGSCVFLFTLHDSVEAQVEHRRRLEAIGRLGSGVAHDFNNLLASVRASVEYLQGASAQTKLGDAEIQQALIDIHKAAGAASEMTSRLLGFAREKQGKQEQVALSSLCQRIVDLASASFPKNIEIKCNVEQGIETLGDPAQLHSLLMNLMINARDAMPEGGRLAVSMERASIDDVSTTSLNLLQTYAVIRVEDTGVGMDERTRERAFDPFFTTKSGEVGAGLGLAAVYEIAQAHNGHVTVHSQPGHGTVFEVVLPVRTGHSILPMPEASRIDLKPPKTRLLILIVDDEDVVRRGAGRVVRQSGHRVIFASSGEEAIRVYLETQPRPDLILMDLNMPSMTGDQTFRALRKLDMQAPVVFVSGYWDNDLETQLRQEGALGFVQKPYEAATLRDAIVQAMTAQAT